MNCNKGILLVISGPAGSGKGTTIKCILDGYEGYAYSVSATTRVPREGETDGKSYFFITREKFQSLIESGMMLEWADYCGNLYGTPREAVEKALSEGTNVILEIDVQGALQVKAKCPNAVLVMIAPPDYPTLEARLRGRGTNTEEDIVRRLATARKELDRLSEYDYIVINENNKSKEAAEKIAKIIECEKLKVSRNSDFESKFYKDK